MVVANTQGTFADVVCGALVPDGTLGLYGALYVFVGAYNDSEDADCTAEWNALRVWEGLAWGQLASSAQRTRARAHPAPDSTSRRA